MCQLLETIKVENGRAFNLDYHNQRLNAARRELYPGCEPIDLSPIIDIPDSCRTGLYRCRVVYSIQIETVEFIPQVARQFTRLKLVTDNTIDYHLKYADRSRLNRLLEQKGDADEIIIVRQDELTDCSIGNLVFRDRHGWWTPAQPLLRGTQRERLLREGLIGEKIIRPTDLPAYSDAGIINAFFDLDNLPKIETANIY